MKKKLISCFVCILILVSGINISSFAQENTARLMIDSVRCDNDVQEITISGHISGQTAFADILIEVLASGTDKSRLETYLDSTENIAQISADRHGIFEYSFPVGRTNANAFDIYVTAPYYGETVVTELTLYETGSEEELLKSSVIVQAGNKLVIKENQKEYSEYVPYMKGTELMLDTEALPVCFDAVTENSENGIRVTLNGITKEINTIDNNGRRYFSVLGLADFGFNVYISETKNAAVITEKTGDYNYEKMTEALGIYMSANGNDANDGSFMSPVQTIEKAIALAAERNYDIGRCVYVREGTYQTTRTVEIDSMKNLCITSYCGENVVFTGGVKLLKEDFSLLTDENMLKRVNQKAKGKIYTLDLKKYLPSQIIADKAFNIFERNERTAIGRWPDKTYVSTKIKNYIINFEHAEKEMWKNEPNPYAAGYFISSYQHSSTEIKVNDDMTITSKYQMVKDDETSNPAVVPLYVYNMLCETDIPGEWYVEGTTLYYYPLYDMQNVEITALRFPFFEIVNSENITIEGITAEKNNSDIVTVSGSKNVNLKNSTFRKSAGRGVYVFDSYNTAIEDCKIYDLDKNGIVIDSCGRPAALESSNTLIKNCRIYNFRNTGISVENGMGTLISGCVIHDSRSGGIDIMNGYDHTVIKNEIYNVSNYIEDAGAIYLNTSFFGYGCKIIDNYVHDIKCNYNNKDDGYVYAIYLDDFTSGAEVSGNTIANSKRAGKIGGGRDNTITNNILIGVLDGMNYDDRGVMGKYFFHPKAMAGSTQEFNGTGGGLYGAYFKLKADDDYNAESWYAKYPGFEQLISDIEKEKKYWETGAEEDYFDAALPINNVMEKNVSIYPTGYEHPISFWWNPVTQYNTTYRDNLSVVEKTNSTIEKIISQGYNKAEITSGAKEWFEDYDNNNYQLKSNSRIFRLLNNFKINNMSDTGASIVSDGMGKPYLAAPENNANCRNVVDFTWNKTGEADYFEFDISKNADMSDLFYAEITNKTSLTVTLPDEGEYYWRVKALDKSLSDSESVSSEIHKINVSGDYVGVKAYGFRQNGTEVKTPQPGSAAAYVNANFVKVRNESTTVVFARKASNGILKEIHTADVTEENKDADFEYNFVYEEGDTIEIYIWSNAGDIYPYTNKIVIN